jgi:hypothetical protein
MRSRKQQVEEMFPTFAADLRRMRPDLAETVVCPLCLREFDPSRINLLSVEHAIPSELGGTIETLTCTKCNNRDGSNLDKHFVSAMKAMDSLEGRTPIKAKMNRYGHIAMNLHLTKGTSDAPITMAIVEKASRESAVEELRLKPPKHGDSLTLHLDFGFIPERYRKAALRAAYLSVFDIERYEYVQSEGGAQVRRVLNGQEPLEPGVVTEAYPDKKPPSDALIMPARLDDIGEYYAVLLRVRSARTRYLCVFLPGKRGNEWSSFKPIGENASRLRIETTPVGSKSKLFIKLNTDPVTAFLSSPSLSCISVH